MLASETRAVTDVENQITQARDRQKAYTGAGEGRSAQIQQGVIDRLMDERATIAAEVAAEAVGPTQSTTGH